MLRTGDAAPDFVLKDTSGKDVRLSSFAGRPIVLYFYKRDHGTLCTAEAKRFKDAHGELERLGGVLVAVSMDTTTRHADFQEKYSLPFHLLSDPEGRVHDLYDAWRTSLLGKRPAAVRRCTYLIDEDGIIRKTYANPNVLRHAKQMIKDLQRLKAQRSWGKKDARPKDLMP